MPALAGRVPTRSGLTLVGKNRRYLWWRCSPETIISLACTSWACYLTGVHLTGVYLMGVHFMGVYLMGVHFIGVYLMGVHLTGVHLMSVYLIGVRLIGVYLMGVHLIDVYFMNVYMFPNLKRLWGKPPDPPPYKWWSIC
jgi:uncharacterized protein YjbI with pentapeptide repeats